MINSHRGARNEIAVLFDCNDEYKTKEGTMYKLYCRIYQFAFRLASYFLPWRKPERLKDFQRLAELLQQKEIDKVLLVMGPNLFAMGAHQSLIQELDRVGVRFVIYNETVPNPTIDNVEDALVLYQQEACSAIIALGGGSPMDCAKAVGARVVRPNKTVSQMRGLLKIRRKLPLFIAIPTTAGSGSETTVAAVISDSNTHEKYAINDPSLIPHYVVLEASLTKNLPPFTTATTGMDALSHAVEAYVGRSNTRQTKRDALRATKLILEDLYKAYENGEDMAARKYMQRAAFLAGTAFTRAYVGYVHAIGHSLGAKYNTSHGLAMAVVMPYVLEMYGAKAHKPLAELAIYSGIGNKTLSNQENAERFIAEIRELNAKMGIPDKIEGIVEEDIPVLAKHALKEANPLYPVPVIFDQGQVESIYHKLC